ncbi:hypothetical protein SAVIM338S_02280 [Streptomyces avidinii]
MVKTADLWRQIPQRNPFERPDAEPAEGCDVCAALVKQRTEYRKLRNASGVTDCNVEMRQHPHPSGSRVVRKIKAVR